VVLNIKRNIKKVSGMVRRWMDDLLDDLLYIG
jgi:hypothetical protein